MISYFPKRIRLDDLSPYGEPTVRIVRPQDLRVSHVKVASEALDYIKNVKPVPGKTIILVLAMTAGEFYQPNRNGDGWPERPLRVGPTTIGPDEVLPQHYKSFETAANVFKHHVNKDPSKKIGDVLRAFYNWDMHRVELLLALDNRLAEDIVDRVERGEFPAVSMGCFVAGTLVTMADGTRKPIETITVGDMVLTHHGRARRVTKVHTRPYHNALYSVKPCVYPAVTCTAEHPYLTVQRAAVRFGSSQAFRWNRQAQPATAWAHAQCLEADEHMLLEPVISETLTPDYVTRAFARLFGYYLAEGWVMRNEEKHPVAIQLIVNKNDAAVLEIEQLCREFGTRNAPNIYPKANSDAALVIDIFDPRLADLCLEHGGSYAKCKRLSNAAMRWHVDMQREILGAYANGDGTCTAKGELKLSTASTDLAWQLVALCHRLGILPSIENLEHKAHARYSSRTTYEWVVHIGKQWAQTLLDVCSKVKPVEVHAHRNDRMRYDVGIVTPIRSVTSHRTEKSIQVYNLEVEEDESYVAGGMSVHNCKIPFDVCSICGNKAPSRAQYCEHARDNLGEYLPSGKQVFVWNPSPKFFDISIVRRPADRVAFMMKKVAEAVPELWSSADWGEKEEKFAAIAANARKLAVIQKIIDGTAVATKDDAGVLTPAEMSSVESFANNVARPAAAATPQLDDSILRELLAHRPAEVLSTLASLGIFLTTPEFIKLLVWKWNPNAHIPDEALARVLVTQQDVFSILARNPELLEDIDGTGVLDVDVRNVNPELVARLAALREKRSFDETFLRKRLVDATLQKYAAAPGRFLPAGFWPWEARPTPADTAAEKAYGRAVEPGQGYWDTLNVVDPETGATYQTTRGSAIRGHRFAQRERILAPIRNVFGSGALLSGAYKLLGQPQVRMLPEQRRRIAYGRPLYATTGEEIHPGTELRKTGAFNMKLAVLRLAHDAQTAPRVKVAAAPIEKIADGTIQDIVTWLGQVICP